MYFHAFYSLLNAATEVATFCIELLQKLSQNIGVFLANLYNIFYNSSYTNASSVVPVIVIPFNCTASGVCLPVYKLKHI
jgi:hypothetical protein